MEIWNFIQRLFLQDFAVDFQIGPCQGRPPRPPPVGSEIPIFPTQKELIVHLAFEKSFLATAATASTTTSSCVAATET